MVNIVADVGNTRIKWGWCAPDGLAAVAALPPDDPAAWEETLATWEQLGPRSWTLAGVHPARRDRLAAWLRQRGEAVRVLTDPRDLPLAVKVPAPERVGIDRLLDAVAANTRRRPGVPAVVVDAGSAVTVDAVDAAGAFRGGAIFPGLRLMAQALHSHTALLPLVEVRAAAPPVPAADTPSAVAAGVYWAVVGGVEALVRRMQAAWGVAPDVFLGGGDARLLAPGLAGPVTVWPEITLEGLRLTAETLP
jgi:type III pantothenate kinase